MCILFGWILSNLHSVIWIIIKIFRFRSCYEKDIERMFMDANCGKNEAFRGKMQRETQANYVQKVISLLMGNWKKQCTWIYRNIIHLWSLCTIMFSVKGWTPQTTGGKCNRKSWKTLKKHFKNFTTEKIR